MLKKPLEELLRSKTVYGVLFVLGWPAWFGYLACSYLAHRR